MNVATRLLLLTLAVTGWAVADVPRKPPPNKYASLWENSPFTSKPPPPPPPGEAANPLGDYALAGVSPIATGYRVTLLNKKTPEERITVDSDNPKSEFQILEVIRTPGDPLATIVKMSSGSDTGTVAFDEKLLTLVAPPAAKPPAKPGAAPTPPGAKPAVTTPQPGERPRPRVIPPASTNQPQSMHSSKASSGQSSPNIPRPIHRGRR